MIEARMHVGKNNKVELHPGRLCLLNSFYAVNKVGIQFAFIRLNDGDKV